MESIGSEVVNVNKSQGSIMRTKLAITKMKHSTENGDVQTGMY
jgi:hypothetical protein